VVAILNHFVRFGVPMMYAYSLMSARFGTTLTHILALNPLFSAVLLMHRGFWVTGIHQHQAQYLHNEFPAHMWLSAIFSVIVSGVVLRLAQAWFTAMDKRIPERL
jgi:ABC-2 type transport system permease protein